MSRKKDPLAQEDAEVFKSIQKFAQEEYHRTHCKFTKDNPGDLSGKEQLQKNRVQFKTTIVSDRLREHFAERARMVYRHHRERLNERKRALEKKEDNSEELQAVRDELKKLKKKVFEEHFVDEKMTRYMDEYESSQRKKRVHDSISNTGTFIVLYIATLLCFSNKRISLIAEDGREDDRKPPASDRKPAGSCRAPKRNRRTVGSHNTDDGIPPAARPPPTPSRRDQETESGGRPPKPPSRPKQVKTPSRRMHEEEFDGPTFPSPARRMHDAEEEEDEEPTFQTPVRRLHGEHYGAFPSPARRTNQDDDWQAQQGGGPFAIHASPQTAPRTVQVPTTPSNEFEGWTPEQRIQFQEQQIQIQQQQLFVGELNVLQTAADTGKMDAEAGKINAQALDRRAQSQAELMGYIADYQKRATPSKATPSKAAGKPDAAISDSPGFLRSAYNVFGGMFTTPSSGSSKKPSQAPRPSFKLGNWYVEDSVQGHHLMDQFLDYSHHVLKENPRDTDHVKDVSIRFVSFLFVFCDGNEEKAEKFFHDYHQYGHFLEHLIKVCELRTLTISEYVQNYIKKFKVGMEIIYRMEKDGKVDMIKATIVSTDSNCLAFGTFKIKLSDRERDTSIERILPTGSIDEFLMN